VILRAAIAIVALGAACAPTDFGGGSGRFPCGENVCEADQTCCGCGFCAAPGQDCPDASCEAEDAWIDDPSLPPPPCTTRSDCPASHYCARETCGAVGTCTERPSECAEEALVCGCDGRAHAGACAAAAAGTSVDASRSDCEPVTCAAMDALGEGLCGAFFGWTFDGTGCAPVTGCACTGADCGVTFAELVDCEAAYGACAP